LVENERNIRHLNGTSEGGDRRMQIFSEIATEVKKLVEKASAPQQKKISSLMDS